MSSWPWLGGRKLEEIVSKSLNHIDIVIKTVHYLQDLIKFLDENKMNEAENTYNKIVECERKADDLKRSILQSLRNSYIHPQDREDLLKLIMTVDDIAAFTKSSAKRFMNIYRIGLTIPTTIMNKIKEVVSKTVTAGDLLVESIKSLGKDPQKSMALTHDIEQLEEEIDDLRMEVLEEVYRNCIDKVDIICILIRDLIEDLESISDKCEDTGDIIRLITVTT
ncbi:MAG: phosphate transport regulator [Desulfurococcales archaeon ex4484_58]|nr:MAG: phosphate transport regulator [Desulfurococcales archaeon ex4484_58]